MNEVTLIPFILALAGLALLAARLWPRSQPRRRLSGVAGDELNFPSVSIVVPARNEAAHLPALLHSLSQLDYPQFDVIVVDDCSDDGTGEIARFYSKRLKLTVVTGQARPSGWSGKQWACFQGAAVARGDLLLFTDADTEHDPDSLREAVHFIQETKAGLVSALPFHSGTSLWERLTGPFHLLLLAVTAPYAQPKPGRVYAIGQYLLFQRTAYVALGGHARVKDSFVEDLPLANACLMSGIRYRLFYRRRLFQVRMYASLSDFVRGWRRNIRAGLGGSSWLAPLEISLIFAALTGGGQGLALPWTLIPTLLAMGVLAWRQRTMGHFSVWGAVVWPFSLGLFVVITILAVFDMLTRRPLLWKGRAYVKGLQ